MTGEARNPVVRAWRRLPPRLRWILEPANALDETASLLPPRPRERTQHLALACRTAMAALQYRGTIHRYEGPASVGGSHLRLVTDVSGGDAAYWTDLLFADGAARTVVGRVRGPFGFARQALPDADLVLLRHSRFVRGRARAHGFLTMPSWVQVFLDTHRPLAAIVEGHRSGRSSRKNDLRRVERAGFRPVITTGADTIRDFIVNWYRPFVQARWGESAILASDDWARQMSRIGLVLWVVQGTTRLGGALIEPQGRTLRCVVFGLHDPAAVRDGVLAACYWFMVRHAVEHGYERLRLGAARPVLSDGPLRHKLKWGGVITPTRQWDYLAVRVGGDGAAVRGLLAARPLIIESANRFLALTSRETARGPGQPVPDRAGVSGLLVPSGGTVLERPLGCASGLAA